MKSQQPLVSICIPTYNRPEYLLEALNSCFSQSYKNYEIVITDNSDNLAAKKLISSLEDKRIRYYKNKENIGSFNNLIKVTNLVKGKYVKFLLDDDILAEDCLEQMVSIMEKYNNVGVVCAPLKIVDKSGKRIMPRFYLVKKMIDLYRYRTKDAFIEKSFILRDFLTKEYPCCVPTGIMYRQECFDKLGTFDEKYKLICDVELCMRFATKYDFYYLDKHLSSWRYTPSSETIALLHKKGASQNMFYELTKKYLSKEILDNFSQEERVNIIKDSYFFATKRTTLNIVAAIKSLDIKLLIYTFKIINENEPYVTNKIKLPFVILGEILVAFVHNSMILFKMKTPV